MKAAGRKKRFMAMQAVHSNMRKWAAVLLFLSFGTISGRLPGMVRERDSLSFVFAKLPAEEKDALSASGFEKEEIEGRLSFAEALFNSGDYLRSLQELDRVRAMIDTQAVSPGMDSVMRRLHIRLFFDLSQANIFISNYTEAMNNLLHILDKYVTDSIADRGIIAQCYNNMGSVFLIRGHNSMALEYYNRSLELFRKQKNLEGEGMLHGNIGNVYNSMGLSEEALKHHLSNYNILVKLGKEDNALAHAILNLGLAYQGLGEYQVADKYYNEAIRLIEKHAYNHLKSYAYYNRAVNEKDMGNYLDAWRYADSSISMIRSHEDRRLYAELLKLRGEIEEHNRNYKAANRYLKRSYEIEDSVNREETEEKLALLAYQFDNYKEKQALVLQQRNLELANKKLVNRNLWIAFLCSGILVVVAALAYLYKKFLRQYRINKQAEKKLDTVRKEFDSYLLHVKQDSEKGLEQKNKELLSISLRLSKMQESITSVKQNLAKLKASPSLRSYEKGLANEIEHAVNEIGSGNYWNEFDFYYGQVERIFIDKLDRKYPQLTPNERRLCSFIYLNFSSKEIAEITNRTPQSVDTAKSRLKKKMKLDANASLYDAMHGL